MADKEGLTDEAKTEIQAAIKILREDGIHIHKTYDRYLKSRVDKDAEAGSKAADAIDPAKTNPLADPNPTPPPPPENPEPNEPPKKKGLWWGDKSDD